MPGSSDTPGVVIATDASFGGTSATSENTLVVCIGDAFEVFAPARPPVDRAVVGCVSGSTTKTAGAVSLEVLARAVGWSGDRCATAMSGRATIVVVTVGSVVIVGAAG